jgi:NTE family protein
VTTRRALVISGGGSAGGAWMLGLVDALRSDGIGLDEADLIVGTSAGARVGAQRATGALGRAVEMHRRSELPQIEVPIGLEQFVAASMRIIAEVGEGQEAARRIANLEPLGASLVSAAEREEAIAAQLPVRAWPEKRLAIAAVDAQTGRRVAFDADSGVALLDAVTASGALPGIFPLVALGGRRYADGGVHSLYNADLAAGYEVVTVLSPLQLNEYLQGKLDAEVAALGAATVHVIVADDVSLAAIGSNPLGAQTARAALDAGAAQAAREIDALRSVWSSPGDQVGRRIG